MFSPIVGAGECNGDQFYTIAFCRAHKASTAFLCVSGFYADTSVIAREHLVVIGEKSREPFIFYSFCLGGNDFTEFGVFKRRRGNFGEFKRRCVVLIIIETMGICEMRVA